jgi:hypothetical protein
MYVSYFTNQGPAIQIAVLKGKSVNADLAPCDFFLFARLKNHLAGRKYQTRKNLGSAIFQCLNSIKKVLKTHLKTRLKY